MRIFAIPFEEISCTRDLKRKSEGLFIGVWRSWLAHLVWDQRVLCSSHSTPTYERLSVWMTSFFVYGPVCMRCRRVGQNKKNESQMSNAFETRKILSILRFTTLDMKDYSVKDATSSLHVGTTSTFSPYISITPLMSPEKFFLMDNVPKSAVFVR